MWTYVSYNELYHHGVQGMHWGERNGPPYPLSDAKRDRLEARADKRQERADAKAKKAEEKKAEKEKNALLTKKQKKIVAIGAAAVGVALLAVKRHKKMTAKETKAELDRIAKETGYKKLSDDDLAKKVERLKMENTLVSVALGKDGSGGKKEGSKGGDSAVSKGKSFVESVFNSENAAGIGKSVLVKVATNALSGGLIYGLSAAASGKFDRGKLGEAIFNGGPKKK